MNIAKDVTELIGNTPMVRINSLSDEYGVEIIGKCEFMNPSGSIKDRIGRSMIEDGIQSGKINENTTIIEPTSGNTGIGLASVCASKGIKLILTMPESMSLERRQLLGAFGAKLELTPAGEGMKGAIKKAKGLQTTIENSIILGQFENGANPQAHRETTALEILRDTQSNIDTFVAAVGTGGTVTGVGEILKEEIPDIQVVAVEPAKSPVLSGGSPAPHKIQGIGAGFIPKILNVNVFKEVIKVADENAIEMSRHLAKKEGLLVGISSGANLYAALQVAKKYQGSGKRIVTVLCDTGERYLSSGLYT